MVAGDLRYEREVFPAGKEPDCGSSAVDSGEGKLPDGK